MFEEYKYIPKQGKLTAICRTVHDGWNKLDLPQLTVGESYSVECVGIYKDMGNTRKTSEVEKLLTMVTEQEI